LASAVANEGGAGVISSAGLGLLYKDFSSDFLEASIHGLKEEIRKTREKTVGVIGVNVMVAMTNFTDMIKTAISEKVDLITAGAGLPLDLPSFLKKDSTTKLIPIVSSARATKIICEKWKANYDYLPDAVIVEGPKAGGHLGFKEEQIFDQDYSLEKLVPEIVNELKTFEDKYDTKIPLIAAGGIFTGRDIARFLRMGASGVQMATRFVCTEECDAHDNFKHAYLNAKEGDLTIINSPVGLPGRVINNKFVENIKQGKTVPFNCKYHCLRTCNPKEAPYCIAKVLSNAARGKLDESFVFAGSNAYRCTEIVPVKVLVEKLTEELASALAEKKLCTK